MEKYRNPRATEGESIYNYNVFHYFALYSISDYPVGIFKLFIAYCTNNLHPRGEHFDELAPHNSANTENFVK